MSTEHDEQQSAVKAFWAEIPPSEHLVQIYEEDSVVLDALEGFIGGGLRAGDGVLVIATAAHLHALEERLTAQGVDVGAARATSSSRGQPASVDAPPVFSLPAVRAR